MFIDIYNTILYQPIFNVLVYLYNIVPGNDIGIAIILLTVLIKMALFPLSKQSIKSQKSLQIIQPKMEELKRKYKDNKEKQAQALMELYKKEKVNPFSSCLPLLIQFPFLIAVYHVFRNGLTNPEHLSLLYPFVQNPGMIDSMSFGVINLAERSIPLAVVAGISQLWQTRMLVHKKQPEVNGSKDEGAMASMNKQMMYFMPALTVFIGFTLPSGLMLYWVVTSLLTVAQQKLMFRKDKDNENTETEEDQSAEQKTF